MSLHCLGLLLRVLRFLFVLFLLLIPSHTSLPPFDSGYGPLALPRKVARIFPVIDHEGRVV